MCTHWLLLMSSSPRDLSVDSTGPRRKSAHSTKRNAQTYKLKVVLVGDISVGKTSLATRFTKDKFMEVYSPTIGACYISKVVNFNNDTIEFQIWDTAGQERYKSLVPNYLRNASIAMIVYDVTDPISFAHVRMWLDAIQNNGDIVKTVLVANKCDMESKVEYIAAADFARLNDLQFVKTSAKTGDNVEGLFLTLGCNAVKEIKRAQKEKNRIPAMGQEGGNRRRRLKCCLTG